jgi:hypothetical protein
MTNEPDEITPHHTVTFTVSEDGYVGMEVACPHESLGAERPCATWEENGKDEHCICECEACKDDDHAACFESWVEGIGQQWCQCRPMDVCWYQHMASEVGPEAFNFGRDGVKFTVPVKFTGGSPDDAIDVEVVA